MIRIKKYRNELKYFLTNQELSLLNNRIEKIMDLDPYTPKGGRYIIHSLYFDDYKDSSLNDTDAGLSKRFKYRIRYYNNDLNYIVLERKEKIACKCHKKTCRLTKEEYDCIISNNITDIIYSTNKELLKQLARDMLMYNYKPKVIIDYERIAYVNDLNIRVTFDMKISASYEIDKFLTGDYLKFYLYQSGLNLLEVKFDNILPGYIKNIIESYGFKQTSFSKYYYGRKIIDSYMR